ncbi:5-oxoprolinase (ATP-hydrolyzing) [Malassezia cuniculi]|uniref:5-oxoprolinase (ATP-hydrolyzing) n=1 Tax=Malassezia cuniculi TaxID=948313 RepID=A0AAF0EXK6_9BASI|nr:5-oxoprolinase (ATP-hydrolyzing) [Malassezia cuniculi]
MTLLNADGKVVLWKWADGVLSQAAHIDSLKDITIDGEPFGAEVWKTAIHPDGTVFVAAASDNRLALFSALPESFGKGIRHFKITSLDHCAMFGLSVAFNHDGTNTIAFVAGVFGGHMELLTDRGGTFTDCIGRVPSTYKTPARDIVVKLLSRDPANYRDAPTEGIRRILSIASGRDIPRSEKIETSSIEYIRLSTTVATNALLERDGEKHVLVTTRGFGDIVQIGNQARPSIFDLAINKPDVLYSDVLEVDERVTLVGYTSEPQSREHAVQFSSHERDASIIKPYTGTDLPPSTGGSADAYVAPEIVQGESGEAVAILKRPDESVIRADLQRFFDQGYRSLAIVFVHSYTFPDHEQMVKRIAKEVGFPSVSCSAELMPMIKMVPRATSATADAYLTPVLQAYIDSFFSGFDPSLRDGTAGTRVEFMMSDGGLTSVEHFSGLKSVISGPAGGVVGMALTSYDKDDGRPIVGFDMGGTSTDVSRYAGKFEQVMETTIDGVTIQSPQLDVNTVASGGSSRLFFRNGLFVVGPESASAHPGPTCYRKGGPLTITDANLVTGRLATEMFPRIFGPNENEGPDLEASTRAFEALTRTINAETGRNMSVDDVALGFIRVANETMARPIRALTQARGYSTSKHVLASFGGAGGQHACAIARSLGISTVLIHRYSSILSAYGMALADRVFEAQQPCSETWKYQAGAEEDASTPLGRIRRRADALAERAAGELRRQGFSPERIHVDVLLNMRYDGTDTALMTAKPADSWDVESAFVATYRREFGFVLTGRDILVDDVRVRAVGRTFDSLGPSALAEHAKLEFTRATVIDSSNKREVCFDGHGRITTSIVRLADLKKGDAVPGPAILIDETQTILVEPGSEAHILSEAVLLAI